MKICRAVWNSIIPTHAVTRLLLLIICVVITMVVWSDYLESAVPLVGKFHKANVHSYFNLNRNTTTGESGSDKERFIISSSTWKSTTSTMTTRQDHSLSQDQTSVEINTMQTSSHPEAVSRQPVLLTLATTFSNVTSKRYIYVNTIRNWALLRPHIQPVLFVTNRSSLSDLAEANGWAVHRLARTHPVGLPYIKDMFRDIQRTYNSSFYGYSNGDILYDDSLINTVSGVLYYLPRTNNTLITGRRTNYNMNSENISTLDQIKVMASHGSLFIPDAEDYFIIPFRGYPWAKLKNVVIGRPAFDNYIVAMGIMNNVTVIDATPTLTALHQSGKDGNFAGGSKTMTRINKDIIGKFNYYKGLATCANYTTDVDVIGKVWLTKKKKRCKYYQ